MAKKEYMPGDTFQVKLDEENFMAYEVTARPPKKVRFKGRKNNRGRWGTQETELPILAFKVLIGALQA